MSSIYGPLGAVRSFRQLLEIDLQGRIFPGIHDSRAKRFSHCVLEPENQKKLDNHHETQSILELGSENNPNRMQGRMQGRTLVVVDDIVKVNIQGGIENILLFVTSRSVTLFC